MERTKESRPIPCALHDVMGIETVKGVRKTQGAESYGKGLLTIQGECKFSVSVGLPKVHLGTWMSDV